MKTTVMNLGLKIHPQSILNVDETGLSTNLDRCRILCSKGERSRKQLNHAFGQSLTAPQVMYQLKETGKRKRRRVPISVTFALLRG
uniref:Transposase n=1 Tax=Romanomermis culicivorax TaxID=13658 RepID=A0A915J4K5_ROMCU